MWYKDTILCYKNSPAVYKERKEKNENKMKKRIRGNTIKKKET
jgi:hypothetical protein